MSNPHARSNVLRLRVSHIPMTSHLRSILLSTVVAAAVGVLIYICFGVLFWSELSFLSRETHHSLSQFSFQALTAFAAPALWLYDSRSDSSYFVVGLVASTIWGIVGYGVRLLFCYLHGASNRTNVA